jgi:uncharacterized Zn finger protein (UPF0148 family)
MKKCLIPHEKQGCVYCLFCGQKINLDWKEKIEKRARECTQEFRQSVLDVMRTGKTIGETAKELKIDSDLVVGIININIDTIDFLRTESV